MNRRDYLKMMSAGAAGAALDNQAFAQPSSFAPMLTRGAAPNDEG